MKKLPSNITIDHYEITKNDKVFAELPWFVDAVAVFTTVCEHLEPREFSYFYAYDTNGKRYELDHCYYIEEF